MMWMSQQLIISYSTPISRQRVKMKLNNHQRVEQLRNQRHDEVETAREGDYLILFN
jgi:hypothetical protein